MGSEFLARNRRSANQSAARVPLTRYCHNPYSQLQSYSVVTVGPASQDTLNREVARRVLPAGTLRVDLSGKVPFHAFPESVLDRTRQRSEAPPLSERPDTLRQVFFGQLPYKVSDAMVLWLCEVLAESDVLFIERVMQDKSRKGCMQVFVDEEAAEYIITALNKRVLFDRTGVWQACTPEQLAELEAHCSNDMNRFKGFPYRPMVVELATSTYVRRHRNPPQSRRSGSATPPPEDHDESIYNDSICGEVPAMHDEAPFHYPPMYAADVPQGYYYDGDEAFNPQPQPHDDELVHTEYYIPNEGPYRSYIPSYEDAVAYDAPPQYNSFYQYYEGTCDEAHCGSY